MTSRVYGARDVFHLPGSAASDGNIRKLSAHSDTLTFLIGLTADSSVVDSWFAVLVEITRGNSFAQFR